MMGVPGNVVRSLDADAAAAIRSSVESYVVKWQRYADGLVALT